MTRVVFNQWLKTIDKKFSKEKRKILLFVDNVSTHLKAEPLKNITIKYFPANTTSKLQPLDQGIIRSFKAKFKTYFLRQITSPIGSHLKTDPNMERIDELKANLKSIFNSIDLNDAINWTVSAWNDVTQEVIENCFRISGFDIQSEDISIDDNLSEMNDCINDFQITFNETLMNSNEFTEFEDNFDCIGTDWRQELLNEAKDYSEEQNNVEDIEISDNEFIPDSIPMDTTTHPPTERHKSYRKID